MTLFIASCGRDGRDGSNGQKPQPEENPKPKPEEIDQTISCSFDWQLAGQPAGRGYKLSYEVLLLKTKEVHAEFKNQYYTASEDQAEQVIRQKFKDGQDFSLSTPMWFVSLNGEKAKFRNLLEASAKEVACK